MKRLLQQLLRPLSQSNTNLYRLIHDLALHTLSIVCSTIETLYIKLKEPQVQEILASLTAVLLIIAILSKIIPLNLMT